MFFAASKQQVSYTDFRDINNELIYFQRVKPFDVLQVESHVIPLALHRFLGLLMCFRLTLKSFDGRSIDSGV